LRKNTDIVTASVSNVLSSVEGMYSKLADSDFDYDKMVDEEGPNEMFDVAGGEFEGLEGDSDVNSGLKGSEVKPSDASQAEEDHEPGPASKVASELLDSDREEEPLPKGQWEDYPTDALTKVVKALSSSEDFATDKTVQTAVAAISSVLSTRNPELEQAVKEEGEGKQASKKTTKCVDCDKPGEASKMKENPDGAGYLCPGCLSSREKGGKKEASAKTSNKYIKKVPGHKDSEGKDAPWVITQKGTGKILSGHATEELAEEAFKAMERSKHGNFKGLNLASFEVEASGTDSTRVTDSDVLEGDSSVTASGEPATQVGEIEVKEGDESIGKSAKSHPFKGLSLAGIEG
jgi:hypothetical protein